MDGMTTHEPSRIGQRESEREREREREKERREREALRAGEAQGATERPARLPRGNTVLSCVASTRLTGLS